MDDLKHNSVSSAQTGRFQLCMPSECGCPSEHLTWPGPERSRMQLRSHPAPQTGPPPARRPPRGCLTQQAPRPQLMAHPQLRGGWCCQLPGTRLPAAAANPRRQRQTVQQQQPHTASQQLPELHSSGPIRSAQDQRVLGIAVGAASNRVPLPHGSGHGLRQFVRAMLGQQAITLTGHRN